MAEGVSRTGKIALDFEHPLTHIMGQAPGWYTTGSNKAQGAVLGPEAIPKEVQVVYGGDAG